MHQTKVRAQQTFTRPHY